MHKPTRKTNEISQQFNDGYLDVFTVTDEAPAGRQPKPHLTPKIRLLFEEQRLGINRIYLSRQQQAEILRVLRVPRVSISTQDVVRTYDGNFYSIGAVQNVKDVFPPSLDISLTAVKQEYEGLIDNAVV